MSQSNTSAENAVANATRQADQKDRRDGFIRQTRAASAAGHGSRRV